MIRLHLRVFATGPGLPAAAGLAALVVAAAILTVAASIRTGIPIENVTTTMLLSGSVVTSLMLPPRSRPALPRRVVDVPVRGRGPAPVPPEGAGAGAIYSQPGEGRLGQRPAAARLPVLPAAGPAYRIGRATVPIGGTP